MSLSSTVLPALQNAAGEDVVTWPEIGGFAVLVILVLGLIASLLEYLKHRKSAGHEEQLRQLVSRYEQLAEKTMDAEQRVAADVSELRVRTQSIEQILRSVE